MSDVSKHHVRGGFSNNDLNKTWRTYEKVFI
jgi:hypothetical protein